MSLLTEKQQQQMRKAIGPVPQFSRRTVWMVRLALGILMIVWVAGALYLHYQVKVDEQKIEQARIEANRRQEFLRRGAQYQQELQERTNVPRARNVFDGR